MTALLEITDAAVAFGGLRAVDGVSFTVAGGELTGLIGPNGAGKTTLLRLISGILRGAGGSVRLAGREIGGLAVERRARLGLGLSQQIVRPFRTMSVADNVTLAAGAGRTRNPLAALFATDRGPERRRALALLERVGIADAAEAMPDALPLGYLKRLEVARALATEPRLLLLDEPLAGLNSVEAARFADTVTAINASGVTVLLIEHNLGEVMRICRRLLVLDQGKLIADGAPAAVMAEPSVRAAYLGEGGHAAA